MKRIPINYLNHREVLDCANPLALLDEAQAGAKAVEGHRIPRRWRVDG